MDYPRIAILILAHKNQQQLEKLINHLKTDFSIYVHLDLKSKLQIKNEENVQAVRRYRVNWGSYSQVLATRELMTTAGLKNYERYLLISGQCLPIKSNRDILEFFRNDDHSYILGEKLPASFWDGNGGLDRLSYFYLPGGHPRRGKYFTKYAIKLAEEMIHIIQDITKCYRKVPDNLYGGTNWFNLTHDALKTCLDKMYDNEYMRIFKHVLCVDEIVLQTILYNSKQSALCISESLRYTDWGFGMAYPRVLILKDLEKIMSSGKLFARKFDETVDSKIIDKIYEKIK